MAHRSTLEPAVLDLKFTLASGDRYIDIPRELSKVNRRLYRQGKTYYVGGATLHFAAHANVAGEGQPAHSFVKIFTAPNTWMVHNAWKKAFAAWKQQQRDSLAGSSVRPGTWSDFKVYLDDHHQAGSKLNTEDGDGNNVQAGEWVYSLILDATDDAAHTVRERRMHLVGPNIGTSDWGLVTNYQDSRATVTIDEPNVPGEASSSMYALLAADKNEVADDVIENIEEENDSPPYDFDEYPGGDTNAECVHEVAIGSTAGGLGTTKGFQAPCGLIMVEASANVEMTLHLMPGNYRGVAATPMGQ